MTHESVKEVPGLNRADLPKLLASLSAHSHGAEVGVQKGENARELLLAGVGHLLLVDLWAQQGKEYFDIANKSAAEQDANYRETLGRMEAFPGRWTVLRGWSHLMAAQVPDGSLDFVYIDADHKEASVTRDLEAWYPKVRAGGIVSGHDFLDSENNCGSEFGVATAVKKFCASIGVAEVAVCQTECWPNWHFVRPA